MNRSILIAAVFAATGLFPYEAGRGMGDGGRGTAISGQVAQDTMRVLWIAAHPDDEDTNLIAWLARGRNVNTAYMSLTRGDGGQNLIGNELGEALGVIRTEELLAARRIDGAHQYFGREYDFGFSKTAEETRLHWPQDSVLNDVMTVIRAFRPHIIITTFSGTPRDGHGHHQISAIVARDAYNMAADTVRFPVSRFGKPWTPLKLYRLARSPQERTLAINVGEYNPYLGLSYQEIAADSRSQHKSQGEGTQRRKGVVWDYLMREDSRVQGPPAKEEKSIFAGIDTTKILVRDGRLTPPVAEPPLQIEAVADRPTVVLNQAARVTISVYNRGSSTFSFTHGIGGDMIVIDSVLPDSVFRWTDQYEGGAITQPWWLAQPRNGDLFTPRVSTISEDERSKSNWEQITATIGGHQYTVRTPIVFHYVDRVRGDVQLPVTVVPGISITLDQAVAMARANAPIDQTIRTTLRSGYTDSTPVTVTLTLPRGLTADSATRAVTIGPNGTRTLAFRVRGRLTPGMHEISATAAAKSLPFHSGYVPIEYPHIDPQRIYRPSTLTISAADVVLPARLNVGYVAGVGDNVAPVLEQLGVPVSMIDPDDIPTTNLSRYSAIVVGTRAYQASQTLIDNNQYLLDYVRNGGRLVVQYGQGEMQRPGIMPYPITLQQRAERVTNENAPVTFTDPKSPLLNAPNRITQDDFRGWVQERATYMPSTFDSHYHSMLSMNDPGEQPNRAGILAAAYGRGTYIYVPLALFRQLPAGVPGGARIFANLLGGNTIR